jgi:hypothetical protein
VSAAYKVLFKNFSKMNYSRRSFVRLAGSAGLAAVSGTYLPEGNPASPTLEVVNPFNRVPVSMIIDDSTCLVNMAYYGIPQFGEVFPDQYKQDWRSLPHEIPDSFVREFGEWSIENGVKGKYSVVPYPACTGWVNRFIPGWTKAELQKSLDLIREVIVPNWDIHPEMVSHTRVIDIKTGKPFPDPTPEFMENWEWSQNKSVDELASYQAYALAILKDAGLECEGLTTPGGYGSRNQNNLALSTLEAVRDIYHAEIPHFFRDLYAEKDKSVAPLVLHPSGLEGTDPKCVVSVIGCTGDWFGGWDGLEPGDVNKFISNDLSTGRMVDVIESGEPAIMVCHWPGLFYNGKKTGFNILKEIKRRLDQKYDNLIWMKTGEIARYWAAKELTKISHDNGKINLYAPFATEGFTLRLTDLKTRSPFVITADNQKRPLENVKTRNDLKEFTWYSEKNESLICFNLTKGSSTIAI